MERQIQQDQQDVLLSQMINEKERQISKLSERVQRVTEQNSQLKRQLQRASRDNDMLKRKLQDDPLYNIFSQSPCHPSNDPTHTFISYQQLQHRLCIYHQQLQSSARQILLLRNKLTQRERMIIDQQHKLLCENQYKKDLQRENNLLKVQLQTMSNQVISYRSAVQTFQQKLNHEKLMLENLKLDIQSQNLQDNHQITRVSKHLIQISREWTHISQYVLKRIKQPSRSQLQESQLKEINNRQKLIMEDLGREMDQRNQIINQLKEEVMRLKQENQRGIQYHAQRHTMVEMINNAKAIEDKYKQMVDKFKHMVEALAKSADEKELLRKQYMTVKAELENFNAQRDEIKAIKSQYQNYKNLYQSTSQSLYFLEENMVQVLTENEALHNFMYKSRGSKVYMDAIAEQLRKYEMQQKQRQQEYKWANVTELINMNIKLTNRIRQKS